MSTEIVGRAPDDRGHDLTVDCMSSCEGGREGACGGAVSGLGVHRCPLQGDGQHVEAGRLVTYRAGHFYSGGMFRTSSGHCRPVDIGS